MRIRIGILAIILELGLLSCSGVVMAQYPAQRFGKVTASQVETGSVTLTSGTQAATIAAPDVARWNSLGSGIAAESDPVFGASAAGAITSADVASWNSFVVSNAWLTHPLYPSEVLTQRALNLSRLFGTSNRLLVQGYADAAWSGNITPNLGAGSTDQLRAAHLFTNLTIYQTPHYNMLDHSTASLWTVSTLPAASYWLACKFDAPTQINRVRHYKYGGWGNPWPSFTVWGSDDSTNGQDGHWTQLAGPFTLGTGMDAVTTCDFQQNTRAFLWLKLVGAAKTLVENAGVREIELESYQPAPDKRFWVDGRGNPGTDGMLTASALTLTTNSQTATLTPADIMNLRNDVWSWIDGSNATSKKNRINIGRQSAGSEMFYVQGYAATPNWVDVSPTLSGDDQSVMNMLPASRSSWVYIASDGSSNPSQNIDLSHGILPNGHDGIRINTKLPTASVVNRLSIYKTGYAGTLAFDNMMVYGSSDSTNGTDGNWTVIAGPFTPTAPQRALANVWVNWDFMANSVSYKWIRLEGDYNATYATGFDYWTELRWFSYQTPPANATWVDGQGNPGTSGCLTAASITLTTNSQVASFGVTDVQSWKSNPWALADDGQNITGRYRNVVLGSTVVGAERLKVIGFQGSGFSANQARLSGMSYYSVSNATNQSWFEPQTSFDGIIAAASGGSGNGWAPGGGVPVWLAFKYQAGTSKVLNKFTLWREGDGSIPFANYSVYGSNNTTNGADGTWELIAGPFLPTIGGGQYYQTFSEDALFLDNKKAFNAYKVMGPVRGGRVLELEAYTYAPTPDKTFYVDAQGNPGTDGKMTAGTLRFTPLAAPPDSPQPGTAYFDSTTNKLRVWDGSAWQDAW